MPSWKCHNEVTRDLFNINEQIMQRINEVVDKEHIHDLGRRLLKVPSSIKMLIYYDQYIEQLIKTRYSLTRISIILREENRAIVFWLHHALDLLLPRIAAIKITGLDKERYYQNILRALKDELNYISNKITTSLLKHDIYVKGKLYLDRFLKELQAKYHEIIKHPCIREEVIRYVNLRKQERKYDPESYLKSIIKQIKASAKKYSPHVGLEDPKLKGESIEARRQNWVRGRFIYEVSRFAAKRSTILDHALLTPMRWNTIQELTLATNKGYLGKHALNMCERFTGNERIAKIIERVREFEEKFLSQHDVTLPQEVTKEYAQIFSLGYEIAKSELHEL